MPKTATRSSKRAPISQAAVPVEDKLTQAARRLAWIVFAATPLGLLTGTFISHDVMPKVIAVMCGAAVLLFLFPKWIAGFQQLRATPHGRWFLLLVAAQFAVVTLSTAFSRQPLLSLAGTTWRRLGLTEQVAVLVIATAVASFAAMKPDSVSSLWRAVTVCAGMASLYAILQYFGIDPFLERRLYAIDYLGGIVRPPATMGHAIYLASYLAPVALIAAWQATRETDWLWRDLQRVSAVLCAIAIVLSGSRGALLGLLAGAAVLIYALRPSKKMLAAGAGAVATAAAFVAFAPAGATLRHRIAQWREDPGSVRLAVWRESPGLIAQSPLLGSGPETFAGAFRQIESAGLSRAYPDFINETPHNVLVDAACELGLSGLLVLTGLFAFLLIPARSPGIRAAAVAMLVCGFFASFSIVTMMYLWGFAGIAAIGGATARKSEKSPPGWWFGVPAGIVLAVLAVILGVQDNAYARLGQAVDENDLTRARQALTTATSFGIGMPGYELWSSQQLARLKVWNDASDAATLAERRGEERALADYQLSILQIVANNAVGAEINAKDAIALAPNWYKPHVLRAQILQSMGRNSEAARELQVARSLGWNGK